jgi:hypothetical protein
MLNRFDDRTLEIATVIVVVLIALVILCYVAIWINPYLWINPFPPDTPTAIARETGVPTMPVTWTPVPSNTPTTPTVTPTPSLTPLPTDTETPTPTSTPTPTETHTPTPTSTLVPTNTPRPPKLPTVAPSPTPYPYDYQKAGARPDCTRTWVHGYVLGANGLPEAGVQIRVGNGEGWRGDVWTDANGYYEATFDWAPKAGRWLVRVFKGGQARSIEFWWDTSAGCTGPYSLQEVEIIWRHR